MRIRFAGSCAPNSEGRGKKKTGGKLMSCSRKEVKPYSDLPVKRAFFPYFLLLPEKHSLRIRLSAEKGKLHGVYGREET